MMSSDFALTDNDLRKILEDVHSMEVDEEAQLKAKAQFAAADIYFQAAKTPSGDASHCSHSLHSSQECQSHAETHDTDSEAPETVAPPCLPEPSAHPVYAPAEVPAASLSLSHLSEASSFVPVNSPTVTSPVTASPASMRPQLPQAIPQAQLSYLLAMPDPTAQANMTLSALLLQQAAALTQQAQVYSPVPLGLFPQAAWLQQQQQQQLFQQQQQQQQAAAAAHAALFESHLQQQQQQHRRHHQHQHHHHHHADADSSDESSENKSNPSFCASSTPTHHRGMAPAHYQQKNGKTNHNHTVHPPTHVSEHSLRSDTSKDTLATSHDVHSTDGRPATVLLVKAVPWGVSLTAARLALERYAAARGAHVTKELVPVWDNHMVFAQLDSSVTVCPGDSVEIEGRHLAVEGAKNKVVDASSPSAVVQVRCLVLNPDRDFHVANPDDRERARVAYARATSENRKLTAEAARAIADALHPRWEDLVVPPKSLRFTRQENPSSRRRYAQVLVKLPSKKVAGEVKSKADGTRIEAAGLTMILRLEYARTNALYIRTPCKDQQRLTLTRTRVKDAPVSPFEFVETFFEITSDDEAEGQPTRNSRKRAKQRSTPADDVTPDVPVSMAAFPCL